MIKLTITEKYFLNCRKKKVIRTSRCEYFPKTTLGKVIVEGGFFSWQLEDAVRPRGVKIYKETAIPESIYKAIITRSPKFKRDTIQLFNGVDGAGNLICTDGIIKFTGVRNHGGNDHGDTEGCPLTAYERIGKTIISGRSDLDLLELVQSWIDEGYEVFWIMENGEQQG